jgi:hypothetical protein
LTKGELGVTGHGARAEYAEVTLLLEGVVPPTLGGYASQTPKETREAAVIKVAQAMGHNDTHTSGAYYGSFAKPQVMNRLGARIGPTLVLAAQEGLTSTLWCSPAPRLNEEGVLAVPRSSIKKAVVVAVVEGGPQTEEIALGELVARWPHCKAKVLEQLKAIGLDLAL